ncbi:MAG: hypothetical protein MHMPM18_001407 [Marteilia pararefringens]
MPAKKSNNESAAAQKKKAVTKKQEMAVRSKLSKHAGNKKGKGSKKKWGAGGQGKSKAQNEVLVTHKGNFDKFLNSLNNGHVFTLNQISEQLQIRKPIAHSILKTLIQHGRVQQISKLSNHVFKGVEQKPTATATTAAAAS